MTKLSKKAMLSAKDSIKSAKDSVKNAQDKLTKIAQDMGTTDVAPDPEQVKEIVESIADVAKEIVQQAETVAEGLESVTGDEVIEEGTNDNPMNGREDKPENDEKLKEMQGRIEEQTDEIEDLTKFKEESEKEKMASDYANLFDGKVRSAKFTEFMKMEKPNSELKTVLSATENALKSLTKVASMPGRHKSNETIIFNDTKQKSASMGDFSGNAKTLSEI